MELPDYWLPQPQFTVDSSLRSAFDDLLVQALAQGPASPVAYTLAAPRWQFLCYAASQAELALHGSPDPKISLFTPRQPLDLRAFGAQNAVYAAADGIWPMFFAILNRERYPGAIMNACIRVETPDGHTSGPFYFFSISRHLIDQYPWAPGTIYLLPRKTFSPEPPFPFGEASIFTHQLASLEPVVPLAKLQVYPEDFPFLSGVRFHDDNRLEEYAQVLSQGLPWPEF
ncbi:MAG: hypothetical protein EHM70_25930 [Chloroflexota bacterium]|nr:MAG: hypothetical protein EHM70_25930 [Chloroflexota bacterium]